MLKLGVVGTGAISAKFVEAAKKVPNVTVAAVCSRAQSTADTFADKYEIPLRFTGPRDMAASEEINAAYIATPNDMHHAQCLLFINSHKHVLCEKPIAVSADEVDEIWMTAMSNNVFVMEAMRLVHYPTFKAIQETMPKIGKVQQFVGSFCQRSSKLDRFNAGESFSAFSQEHNGGVLMDLGCYCAYVMVTLLGEPENTIASGTLVRTGVDGTSCVLCSYEDCVASFTCSKLTSSQQSTEIQGEKGTIVIKQLATLREVSVHYHDGTVEDLSRPMEENDLVYEVQAFYNYIFCTPSYNKPTLDISKSTLRVLESAIQQIW